MDKKAQFHIQLPDLESMAMARFLLTARILFKQFLVTCLCDAREPQARLSGRRVQNTHLQCTQFDACTRHSCFSLNALAADKHFIVRSNTPRRNPCTPHSSAHFFIFVCINVSNPSTYLAVIRLEENHHSKGYITASGERIPNFDRKTVCTISASSKASHF